MNSKEVQLALKLPPQLLRLFTRFPPAQLADAPAANMVRNPPATNAKNTVTVAENTSSSDPNAGASTRTLSVAKSESKISHSAVLPKPARNPFLPVRNPQTGRWHGPHYSLRRQADLFKLAVKYNVLPLMPLSPKHPEVKERKRAETGLRVQGTGVGKKVKGKQWERTMRTKLEERRKAMENMPALVKQWKERGHGRGWKNWPK